MGGRCQGIGGAQGTLPQLVVLLQQIVVTEHGHRAGGWAGTGSSPRAGGSGFPKETRDFLATLPYVENSWLGLQGEGAKAAEHAIQVPRNRKTRLSRVNGKCNPMVT